MTPDTFDNALGSRKFLDIKIKKNNVFKRFQDSVDNVDTVEPVDNVYNVETVDNVYNVDNADNVGIVGNFWTL